VPEGQHSSESTVVAQTILSKAFGRPVSLAMGESLGGSNRSRVTRCHVLDAPGDAPQTVVVKQALSQGDQIYDPEANSGPAVQLFNEWAALQFLAECFGSDSPVPLFFGGNRESGIVVMQDLGTGQRLDTLLLGGDAASAENAMVELFRIIGQTHAVSAGQAERYNSLRDALGPGQSGIMSDVAEHAQGFITALSAAGMEVHAALEPEVESCIQLVHDPGPFAALLHCDPCPDNCLLTAEGMKLLDFEFSQFGLALCDGAYSRMHFPTCWCVNRIPRRVMERAEAAYRQQLTLSCPQAADDTEFGRVLVVACACALFMTLSWAMPRVLQEDGTWGIATLRQRVLVRLNAFSTAAQQWGHLPALGETALQMQEKLRELWRPELQDLPLYPAFRQEVAGE
jgi:hypothetical protein